MKHAVVAAVLVAGLIASPLAQGYVPYRVFDTAAGQFTDFEAMTADLVQADVVFVGEQHDDPNTHRLERMVLEALAARKARVILSLEMFERDTQKVLDEFQAGYLSEAGFLRASRPWPRYATDYKPLVDFAVERAWPVLAANVPRPIASEIAKAGISVLDGKPAAEKALVCGRSAVSDGGGRIFRPVQSRDGGPSLDGPVAALLRLTVRQGRDDGRVDREGVDRGRRSPRCAQTRGGPLQRRLPQ
jgi:hypothetical protein